MKTLPKTLCLLACLAALLSPLPARAEAAPPPNCAYNPSVEALLTQTGPERWLAWIKQLSGALPVTVAGDPYFILSRDTQSMFSGREPARAFDYVLQTVRAWVRADQIELDEYNRLNGLPWYNLIVTFPGTVYPDEVVVLAGHLDSKSETKPLTGAPGADDNATGAATLLEAVRLFRDAHFQRTVQVIFFTGEELGMLGSQGYVKDHDTRRIVAVYNMDMFGYDGDGDRCFEIHAGKLPASLRAADCLARGIDQYGLNLKAEIVQQAARGFSDHSSFWQVDTGAVLVMENFFRQDIPNGCGRQDANPDYHSTTDTWDTLSVSYGFDIARAGIAAAASMAGATIPCETGSSMLKSY